MSDILKQFEDYKSRRHEDMPLSSGLYGFIEDTNRGRYWCDLVTDLIFYQSSIDHYQVDFFIKHTQLRSTCSKREFERINKPISNHKAMVVDDN